VDAVGRARKRHVHAVATSCGAAHEVVFLRGMLAALAVVAAYDQETLFRAIVNTAGENQLIKACEGREDWEWSGLKRYGYRWRPR